MPTILQINGWRFFFYANEGNEPMHVHAQKGDMECKYWLKSETFDIQEAFSYGMNAKDRREVRQIIYQHFELFEKEWKAFQRRKRP